MKYKTYTVSGSATDELPDWLEWAVGADHHRHGDGFHVFLSEEFDTWRTLSGVQGTVILDPVDETTARIEVIAGGGSAGLLKRTPGSETKIVRRVARRVEKAVDSLDLEIVADSGIASVG